MERAWYLMRRHLSHSISPQLLGNQGKWSKFNLLSPHLLFKAEALKTALTQRHRQKWKMSSRQFWSQQFRSSK